MQEIDSEGLDKQDRRYLETLIRVFAGGPTGVEALAATMNVSVDTLEDEVEPYLLAPRIRRAFSPRPPGRRRRPISTSGFPSRLPSRTSRFSNSQRRLFET